MRKMMVFGIVLALAAFFNSSAMACTVTCSGGASCSSTNGDCHCDGSTPHCIDNQTDQLSTSYIEYLQTWNTPGLNRVADAASKVLDARNANDLEAYQRATRIYNEALQKLNKADREIISTWEAELHETAPGPHQN